MKIKKFTASSMKQALAAIKEELGDDALILKTKNLPKKIFARGESHTIEVTAAIDDSSSSSAIAPSQQPIKAAVQKRSEPYDNPRMQRGQRREGLQNNGRRVSDNTRLSQGVAVAEQSYVNTLQKHGSVSDASGRRESVATAVQNPPNTNKNVNAVSDRLDLAKKEYENKQHIQSIKDDMKEMKTLLAQILATGESSASGGFAGPWAILYKRLVDSEINPKTAEMLIQRLKNDLKGEVKDINKKFISILKEKFPVSGAIKPRSDKKPNIIAFVGPTGGGKTTSIAKLASHMSLNENHKVSIITADAYRIAAIEQIRAFAEIVEINLQVVFSPEEIEEALEKCQDDDVVFIDTAGRSQRNDEHMKDLEVLLERLRPDEVHLVLSATTKDSVLRDIVKKYCPYGVNRLVFTKIDESASVGNVFDIVSESGIPVSYLADGQCVPDDIELAHSSKFIQRLLEGSSL